MRNFELCFVSTVFSPELILLLTYLWHAKRKVGISNSVYFFHCVFLQSYLQWCPNVFAPLCFCPLPPGLFNWFMFDLLSQNQWTLPCYSICPDLVFWGGFGFSQCYFFAFLRSSPITCLVLDVVCPVWVGSHVSSKKDIKILNFNVPRF